MNCPLFRPFSILLLLFLIFSSSRGFGDSKFSVSSSYRPRIGARSLLSKSSTSLVAALDGEIHLVDNNSMNIIWSFNSGLPIYSSYQAKINRENASTLSSTSFFFDFGDNWDLYIHTHHGKMKLPRTIDEVVRSTPYVLEDGTVMLGSKKTTVFEVDLVTGELIRNLMSSTFSSELSNEELGSYKSNKNQDDTDLIQPNETNPAEPRLYITRTDYSLKSFFSSSEEVLWSLNVAEIEATLLCPEVENSIDIIHWNLQNKSSLEVDFEPPLSCQSKIPVFRERSHFSSRTYEYKRLSNTPNCDNMSLVYALDPIFSSQLKIDKHFKARSKKLMLPRPASNVTSSLSSDSTIAQGHNKTKTLTGPVGFFVVFLIIMLAGFMQYGRTLVVKVKQSFFKENSSSISSSRNIFSKKKKSRKLRNYERRDASTSSEHKDKDLSMPREGNVNNWFQDSVLTNIGDSGRQIGKLSVTNNEIAKGSNGTIILEGTYDGRPVAVKRLVKSHHDIASKEVQNLMASDCHQNIVRWYGVESDQDFIYLSLERCACSLDNLIQMCSDESLNSMIDLDQDIEPIIEYKLHLESAKNVMSDLKLWKENGHPSSTLLKLMRDMVFGLAHLHELGIIHRDLKPQNVLITKQKSISAKLSDMGISKRLQANMSSLGHRATGCGSSGWQAPEQLRQGRQTRAVDLFSLGCVIFFCITGGRHPFGDRLERDVNIVKNEMDLFPVENIPEAVHLISQLLDPNPSLRPKASEVLHHPLFWSSEMRLSFLRDTSDRMELEDKETTLMKALENTAQLTLVTKWDEAMEPAFIANISRYRRYKYDSVRDLLRVMRNKLNHYRELPKEIQEQIGSVPEGFDGYFASRFPRLLIEVYKVINQLCRQEECFQKYFKSHLD